MAEPSMKLGPGSNMEICGWKMFDNSQNWHYVFVFALETDDAFWSSPAPEPNETWARIFTKLDGTAATTFAEGTTQKQFHQAVFDELVDIFSGPRCGFSLETFRSVDEDELFLLVTLEDDEAVNAIAESEEFPVMLRHDVAYNKQVCATDVATGISREGEGNFKVHDFGEHLDRKRHTNRYPGFVRYSSTYKDHNLYEDFNGAERIRLTRRRMRKFVKLQSLVSEQVVKQFFCVHHWLDLQYFYETKRWNDPCNLLQWPSEHLPDCIQLYFGPDVSFFFHWFNAYTRFLLVPAVLSVPVLLQDTLVEEWLPDNWRWIEYVAFSVVLGIWSTNFLARYKHYKSLKVLKWGMKHYDQGIAETRRQFSDGYRNSWEEYLQQILHWTLCAVFMAETVIVTLLVSRLRKAAREDPLGRSYGIRHEDLKAYGKFIITANIKIIDFVWTRISTNLSKMENWRTLGELRSKSTEKLFAVKFVVFYYPFLYTILIKPIVNDLDISVCFKALSSDLRLFFLTQITLEVLLLLASVGNSWLKVAAERRKAANKDYTYLEYQAKCPEYSDDEFTYDVQLQVINYGFLVMFGVCLPYVCGICFCVNFLFKRILSYKLSYIYQRPNPFGAEGLGSWEDIITLLSWIGVIFNSYLVIFVSPLCGTMSFEQKLIAFLAAEHVVLISKIIIDTAIGPKSVAQRRIEEHQARVIPRILQEHSPTSWSLMVTNAQKMSPASLLHRGSAKGLADLLRCT